MKGIVYRVLRYGPEIVISGGVIGFLAIAVTVAYIQGCGSVAIPRGYGKVSALVQPAARKVAGSGPEK